MASANVYHRLLRHESTACISCHVMSCLGCSLVRVCQSDLLYHAEVCRASLCERALPISPMRKSSWMAGETEEYSVYNLAWGGFRPTYACSGYSRRACCGCRGQQPTCATFFIVNFCALHALRNNFMLPFEEKTAIKAGTSPQQRRDPPFMLRRQRLLLQHSKLTQQCHTTP